MSKMSKGLWVNNITTLVPRGISVLSLVSLSQTFLHTVPALEKGLTEPVIILE